MSRNILAALAGQPNCGKSTIFNMLTGARQHVANYPGVTVEKKTGRLQTGELRVELVDLPGTYSLTSYSLEERVSRDFLLHDRPRVVINVADASNLKRSLYLTLQLLEMDAPLVLNLNMMDVARRRGISIDEKGLSEHLGVPVAPTVGKKREGAARLREALGLAAGGCWESTPFKVQYGPLEPFIAALEDRLSADEKLGAMYPPRWLAVKLLEGDAEAGALLREHGEDAPGLLAEAESQRRKFEAEHGQTVARHAAFSRHRAAAELAGRYVRTAPSAGRHLSDRADRFVCHRFLGPALLLGILFVLYEVSIVFGGWLAVQVWPVWGGLESLAASALPPPGFLEDPLLRSLGVWAVKSVTAILNYLPIFFLLFALIAVLEDSGYMPRMAFILDRLFRRFGLHGQSTLPLILGGVYVGGCAIPAVMATKAIPDERARLATILIAPMMNCLAKVPLYLILIGAYFAEHAGLALFFIATVTLFMALPVAKALTLTVLRGKESAPFIMEMPPYHLPTIKGVLTRAVERILIFVKKIVTVVLAVAVVVFVLINFPGIDAESRARYEARRDAAVNVFLAEAAKTSYRDKLTPADVEGLVLFEEDLRDAKRGADQAEAEAANARFEQANPLYYGLLRGKDAGSKALSRALKKVAGERKTLRREMRAEAFESSFLGMAGRALEPITRFAGFNWRINIALLSAFAAKENSAATLGAIYGIDGDEQSVQEKMKTGETGFTALHALALMLFMALYPPCIPTSVMVRMQSNSTGWMLFSIGYQTLLGLFISTLVFSGGSLLGLTGWQTMWVFYGLCIAATLLMALVPETAGRRSFRFNNPIAATCKGGIIR